MWRVIQTAPFQRLRRVRQLGFSEFVFPGATHSRFAHSLGVFHLARELMSVIERDPSKRPHQAHVALAAALVHDVGHGMFSHAFEDVGRKLGLSLAMHENVSDALIRDSEITQVLSDLGKSFADEVADVIHNKKPGNLYDAVVSSQFDADRLDYMQRDRIMTGVQGSGVDARWILANLEVGTVPINADEEAAGEVSTLVLGPKAFYAAEHYVLSLFQLYPNVYLHKTTRGLEKIFSALLMRLHKLLMTGKADLSGLPDSHPVMLFLAEPTSLERATALDDSVFWGSLYMMCGASDEIVKNYARRLHHRKHLKCIDVRHLVEAAIPLKRGMTREDRLERDANISLALKSIFDQVSIQAEDRSEKGGPDILFDEYKRSPYKKFQDSQTPLNQILINTGSTIEDMAHLSSVVSGAESFEINRMYLNDDDTEGRSMVENTIIQSVEAK